jgi:mannose-6-phosphate isomerase-like protein (cupin superfamily)
VDRRRFISLTAGAGAATFADAQSAASMQPALLRSAVARKPVLVRAGYTRHPDGTEAMDGPQQTIVRSFDSEGRLAAFVIPVSPHDPPRRPYSGAPLHVHHEQDEWLYILGGEFVAEVGGKRMRLKPGDSLLMPMKVPHRWSNAATPTSGAIHLYTPAGTMDLSWDPSPNDNAPETPEQRKAEFEKYGMTLLGPPLTKEEIVATV